MTFAKDIAKEFGQPFAAQAEDLFWQMSVVEDALTAVSAGVHDDGVTAMHDATEGGVLGGLCEIARASEVGMVVDKGKIPVPDEVAKICAYYGMDPYSSISEGTLIITCRPHRSGQVIGLLRDKDIPASVIGSVTSPEKGISLIENGEEQPLVHPRVDPFWDAFRRALEGVES
jgi:hydrogenase maturation factor